MNYVEKNLRKDEEIIAKAKISFLYLVPKILWLAILVVAGIVVSVLDIARIPYTVMILWIFIAVFGGLPLLLRIIVILTTHLVVTNKRVVGKQGVLRIQTLDIPVEKIDNVSFKAGIFGNIFKYYDVTIKSVGSDGWAFHGISNAQAFKDCANDAIEKHAEQARKDQAAQIAMAMHSKPNA